MREHRVCIFHQYFALNVYKYINLDKYAVAVIKKGKFVKHLMNGKIRKVCKICVCFLRADTAKSKEVKSLGNQQPMVKRWVACKIKFTSHKALLDKLKYVLRPLHCYVLKPIREEKSQILKSLFQKNYEYWSN